MTTKLIHQVWIGSEIPVKFMENMADWAILNPDWTYRLWTQPLPDLYNANLYDSAHAYVKPDAVWQFRADLLRYEVLYRYGGFYCDVDTKPLRPLGDLFDGMREWAVAEDAKWTANTYLYASQPELPVFNELVADLSEHLCGAKDLAATVASGPQYLTGIWDANDCYVEQNTKLWFPYSWHHVRSRKENSVEIPKGAYAIHEWAHSRERRKTMDRKARFVRNPHNPGKAMPK